MEIDTTAANPADEGPVTLVDAVEAAAGNQGAQAEATTPAGEGEASIDDLAKEALGEPDATPEEIEVEYEGEKRTLPPKWRDAFLREQDYRRKTMDLAEQRKGFETERTKFQETATQISQNFQANVQLATLQAQIADLEQTDISYWTDEDIAAGQARLAAMKAQAAGIAQNLTNYQQMVQRQQSEQFAKLRSDCLAEAAARIPNFTEQRRSELEKLAVETGADPSEVQSLTDPWAYELLHFADIGRKFIERQRRAAQMKTAHAGTPATMLGGSSPGVKSPEDMTQEEYNEWRNAGNG